MNISKEDAAIDDGAVKRTWIDPECIEFDVPGVTQIGPLNPAPDAITFFS